VPRSRCGIPERFPSSGFDPQTGEVGGAVQSRVFSVGNGVLWADADAGVAATQAIVDVGYGPKALELLRKGLEPRRSSGDSRAGCRSAAGQLEQAGTAVRGDEPEGAYAAHTGPKATEWAGHKGGKFATAQGNILAGPAVVDNMISRFEETTGTCRSAWWRRSKVVRPAAATSAGSSRRRW
jgi:uncharacterized Ntn-hydrolase superfamily protein